MDNATKERTLNSFMLLLISATFVVGNFLWQGHDGFNLWDEGYLWYGAQQIIKGEVPVRDFMAYDPGRYYWSAGFFALMGDTGIVALRAAVAVFQLLGVYAGLWTISIALRSNTTRRLAYLCIAAITLMAWMYPRHKIIDMSLSMIIVASLTYLLLSPYTKRYFFLGAIVGLAAVFGRNHGVYAAVASLIAMGWLAIKSPTPENRLTGAAAWAAGVVVGYLPVLAMCLFIPGYFTAFIDTIVFMLEQGNTNLPLPIPWPWTVGFGTAGVVIETRWFLIGLCFMGLIVFGSGALAWVFKERIKGRAVPPGLVAVACATLPYAHYAFARADVGHLAQGIYPLLLGIFITLGTLHSETLKWALALLTSVVSLFILAAWQPGVLARTQDGWTSVEVSGSSLSMDPSTAEAVHLLRDLTDRYAPAGRSVLVLPFWPGAYPLLGRDAPLWEIYALSPRSEAFQRAEIQRIKKADPGFALVFNMAMDGREELRFSNSHRWIEEYIHTHFEAVTDSPNSAYQIYKAPDKTEAY
ncbi:MULTISPECIES: membrane protein [Pseudomonas syringae group]|uniref:Glycosyltransferase RgtA/B/C/D-like domain-containing protein n=5 Tax=Pseudomonas syringae group TaxID=136849 RepID=A0AB73QJE5_PSESS|nr:MULTISPECIES: membrane protein [Pseudomonas syringae group]ARD11060.1 hypothetical protein PSA3335_08305 [Pseudomonas savastanoi pv. savastanoi NCPPB 3335]KPX06406.1 Uncharacterized protein ALO73_05127 [Pseudomonas syringae pv. daphniphylli]KPX98024.1 Uncharacterized protein ALO61_04205 [Pseudomonas savastanoi pv. nerii]KUG42990.1 Uncharacterized protein ALP79_00493 [Pseudomonas savastanoi pv. fraxini]KWS45123.1 hypothetical protein AL058_22250 [Pseudomonas savastanoi pv. nerii]